MPRPVHFEISADDPDKLAGFYDEVFGWKFEKWDGPMPYWMIMTGDGDGIDGGMSQRNEMTQDVNTLDVDDVDAYTEKLVAAGAKIIVPKRAIPGIGWWAMFEDPEGNKFGMMQNDPTAQ